MAEKKQQKIYDGRYMQGICNQWYIDKYGFGGKELRGLYNDIVRLTFGYRKRYAYIKQEIFCFKSKKTLKKYRDILTSRGILSWQKTKGYTMYKILEPAKYIKNFELSGEKNSLEQNNEPQQNDRGDDNEKVDALDYL